MANSILPRHNNKENVPPPAKYLIGKKIKGAENQPLKVSCIDLTQESYNEGNRSWNFEDFEEKLQLPCDKDNVEGNTSNSFELVLDSLLHPDSYATNKTAPSNSEGSTINEPNLSKSFELALNSLLYPPKSTTATSTTQNTQDSSFNELMNQILTPDLNAPKRPNKAPVLGQNSQTKPNRTAENSQKKSNRMLAEDEASHKEAVSGIVSSQSSNTVLGPGENNKPPSSPIMPWSLPPDWGENYRNNKTREKSESPLEAVLSQNAKEEISSEETSSQDTKVSENGLTGWSHQTWTQEQEVKISGDDLSGWSQEGFSQNPRQVTSWDDPEESFQMNEEPPSPVLGGYLIPKVAETREIKREFGTQTSFDLPLEESQLLPPVRYIEAGLDSSARSRRKRKGCTEPDPNLCAKLLKNPCEEPEALGQVVHVLSTLSNDVTVLPDGRKIYNICKIGTAKWLESALLLQSVTSCTKKRSDQTSIFEAANTSSLYLDYLTTVTLNRFNRGNVKIIKMQSAQNPDLDSPDLEDIPSVKKLTKQEATLARSIDQICEDHNLIRSDCDLQIIDKAKICLKIHSVISQVFEVLERGESPTILVKELRTGFVLENGRLQYGPLNKGPVRRIVHSPKFCRLLYILGKVYSLLQNDTKLTKREIFYQVKTSIKMHALNGAVEDASTLLGVGSWQLNITATRGLVYGNLKLFWKSGSSTNCNERATLIPADLEDLFEIQYSASFILVVEKESIFRKLLGEDLPNKLARPFIMMTGKGNPGFSTRLFLNRISRMMAVPVFILVDPDVYGMSIMLTYRFGSVKSCHLAGDLTVPNARWLGVFPSEISKYGMAFQNMNKRDKSMIKSRLKMPYIESHPRIGDELRTLMDSNRKGSIEGMIKSENFLSEAYLPMKLFNRDFV